MLELAITVALVVLISAACSLSEAVLYSVPISHIEHLAESGRRSGAILRRLRRNIDRPITAILSLNTIANTAGAAIAGALAAEVFGSRWVGLFSGLITLAILFFAEVIPKTAGVVYSRSLATVIARPLQLLVWIFRPLVVVLTLTTRLIPRKADSDMISEEELLVMARLGQRKGVIEEDEAAVIHNILSLGGKLVREVMTPRTVLFSLSSDTTVDQARREDGFFVHSRIPVYFQNGEDIGGIVHRRDVLRAVADDKLDVRLEALMKPVHFVLDKTKLDRLLRLFLERREQMFIVIDEFGGLSGVVTLEDVLEEILGREIVDEFDQVADMRELAQRRRRQVMKNLDSFEAKRKRE
jgi:CBS domain containing-hemolysin-like protein